MQDLSACLRDVKLAKSIAAAETWVRENGAVGMDEVAENFVDFSDFVGLKPLERKRLHAALERPEINPPMVFKEARVSQADLADQRAELEALESIFGADLRILEQHPIECVIRVHIDLPRELKVQVPSGLLSDGGGGMSVPLHDMGHTSPELLRTSSGKPRCLSAMLLHLPPLRLAVRFRAGYPSARAPTFSIASDWVPRSVLEALCQALDDLWQAETPIVFAWVDWLKTNLPEMLNLRAANTLTLTVDASDTCKDGRAQSWLDDVEQTVVDLMSYDKAKKRELSNMEVHKCQLCIEEKPGIAFEEFGMCGHRFCTDCIRQMVRVHVESGQVTDICCPQLDCRRKVGAGVVQRLLGDEQYTRWYRLHVKALVQTSPLLVFCPHCERLGDDTPVILGTESDDTGVDLAVCGKCQYAFCPQCREAYHPASECPQKDEAVTNLQKRLDAVPAADKTARQRVLEELETLKLIKLETVPCPTCKQPINRSAGCNKMKCTLCLTYFCYRCGKDISNIGYAHFGGDSCPTFDREEVERINARQHARQAGQAEFDEELEELRRQYPDQDEIIADFDFRPRPLWQVARDTRPDHTRERQVGDRQCPGCHQWNAQNGNVNLTRCRVCSQSFCFECGSLLRGRAMDHFKGPEATCSQHSKTVREPAAPAKATASRPLRSNTAQALLRTGDLKRKVAKQRQHVELDYWDDVEDREEEYWRG